MGSRYQAFTNIQRRQGKNIDWRSLNRDTQWRIDWASKKRNIAERFVSCQGVELSHCPICQNSELKQFIEVYGYAYVECKHCGHLFMQRPLDSTELERFYQGNTEGSSQRLVYVDNDIFNKRVEQIALPKVNYFNDIIKTRGGLWVDIGCGAGELLIAAKRTGWSVLGYESDLAEVNFAREHGLEIVPGYLTADNLNGLNSAQVVSLLNILEHIGDPVALLKNIVAALPMGSFVVIEVPRHPSLSSFTNLVFPDLVYRHIHPPEHLHLFSESSLEIMLRAAGINPVAIWEFGQDAIDFVFHAVANARLQENEFIEAIIALAADLQPVVDKKGMSDVILVVTIKS